VYNSTYVQFISQIETNFKSLGENNPATMPFIYSITVTSIINSIILLFAYFFIVRQESKFETFPLNFLGQFLPIALFILNFISALKIPLSMVSWSTFDYKLDVDLSELFLNNIILFASGYFIALYYSIVYTGKNCSSKIIILKRIILLFVILFAVFFLLNNVVFYSILEKYMDSKSEEQYLAIDGLNLLHGMNIAILFYDSFSLLIMIFCISSIFLPFSVIHKMKLQIQKIQEFSSSSNLKQSKLKNSHSISSNNSKKHRLVKNPRFLNLLKNK
ncbi:unnamed protein product, partial [marine sediment metagenome]